MQYRNALEYLFYNFDSWPVYVENYISHKLHENYRFIVTLPEEEIVFANMLEPAITEEKFLAYKQAQKLSNTYH